MNQAQFRGRVRRFPAIVIAVLGAGIIFSQSAPAFAQSDECEALKSQFESFSKLIEQAKSNGKRRVDPAKACSLFTKLQATQASLIPMLDKDGAWCHVPDPIIVGVKQQMNPISKAKTDSCAFAVKEAQARKQQQQQRQQGAGPLGGGDSIVGGPVKMPQGAL